MTNLFPFTDRSFDNNGFSQHYVDEGQGHPVVMIHGNPSWSFLYRQLIQNLAANGFRAIAPDHIGCGHSAKPATALYPYTLKRRIEDLDLFITHLQLAEKFTLVVHDWGGMIGLSWALDNMDKISNLIIMNTSAFPLPETMPFPWQIALARAPLLGDLLVKGGNAFARGATRYCVMKPMSPEVKAGFLAPYDCWDNRVAIKRFVEDIPLKETDESWSIVAHTRDNMSQLLNVPAILLWGEKDFVFGPHFLAEWRQRLPELPVVTFPQAGHYLLEDAFDEIWPVILKQLQQLQAL